MSDEVNLFAQQEANRRRSVWLVIGFILFFTWVGFGGDLAYALLSYDPSTGTYQHVIPYIGIFCVGAASWICWDAWRHGSRRILWSTGAWELVEPATPEQKQLMNVVEEMAIASGLPKPKVWVVQDDDPNAFATGRDQESASIAVTEGLLLRLSRDELQGVVAHEMAHIKNLDIRLMTLLAGMVGAIAILSDGMGRMIGRGGRAGVRLGGSGGFGGGGGGGGGGRGSSRGGSGKGGNPLGLIILALWVFTLIAAPVISRLLAMAVSRKREYLADATGAQFTRNPMALASALEKLEAATDATKSITRGATHLCIVDPAPGMLGSKEGFLADFVESHPPIRQRIIRLKGMAYQQAKQEAASA